jgi:hypothetical protein
MDQFESIVHYLLERDGYWVRSSYRVELSREQKRDLGKPSIPRPEIDLIAFNFKRNELLVLEVKSFLDSPGVKISDISKKHEVAAGRYKIFTSDKYRLMVLSSLREQLLMAGSINEKTSIRLGLVAGKVYKGQSDTLRSFLESGNHFFWSPEDIRNKVKALADCAYMNNLAVLTAKILLR